MPSESDKWGWKHVSVFGGFETRTGTKRWKCNHCNLRYNGSYSRVRAHLLGFTGVGVKSCPAIDRSLRAAFHILEEERLAWKKKKIPGSGKSSKRIRSSQPPFSSTGKVFGKEDVDDVVARFFFADGLNFNIINSPYFHEMAKAIGSFGPGYEPPSVEKLWGSFLSKEKARLEKAVVPIRESWTHTSCTILCLNQLDGTLGCFNVHIFASSTRGLIFLQSIDLKEDDRADTIFNEVLSKVIMYVGPANVLQVIIYPGHASNFSEPFINSKFPQIFWSQCTSRSILILMEDIAELDWMKPVVTCAKGIELFILAQQHSLPFVLNQNFRQPSVDTISAKFAPSYHLVWRIVELKQVLQDVVVSDEWRQWKLSFAEDVSSIEATILGSEFWRGAHLMLQLLEPFVSVLASLNVERPMMGDFHNWRIQAFDAVRSKRIDDMVLKQLDMLIDNRWDALFSPLQAAGYILNPMYFGKGQAKDKTVMRGWKVTLEKYEYDGTARRVLREQLSSYWRLEGSLGEEDAVDCRDKMDPVTWWENFGSETPQLQTLAIRLLSQISCVSSFQESWLYNDSSSQEATESCGTESMEDLVFVRNNLRLHGKRPAS